MSIFSPDNQSPGMTSKFSAALSENPDLRQSGFQKIMDKKEINSPWLTLKFLFWVGGVGGVLLFAFIGHFVWRLF
jgi:hypothetical protein